MDQKRLEALLEQATVDCNDEEEEFTGVLNTLDDSLSFPLQAEAMGEPVEVVGLDSRRSSLRKGIGARVRKGGREYSIGLADLHFIDPDPTSAEWLEMYRYWAGMLMKENSYCWMVDDVIESELSLSKRHIVSENRIEKPELITRVVRRTGHETGTVEEILEAALEEIYQALKQGESVSLRNFGTFYVRPERASWIFRFNPSQKWRALFGWSSTYTGEQ